MIKIKRLLLAISVVGFLAICLTSCSEDGIMDGGETGGGGKPTPPEIRKSVDALLSDSIVTVTYFPND